MKREYIADLPDSMKPTAAIFSALGDPVRQRILLLFEPDEALSIKEIADLFALSRTAVVHHLNVLERAGILAQRRSGKATLYSVCPEVVMEAVTALRDYILEEFPGTASYEK
ncbi:MAG: helix-turn-helix domain-containing protein [Deltaproteobacteria bacterium]|nr:helix-turn-helix domain-containing protein [Deltaproteobacteria bacterium]